MLTLTNPSVNHWREFVDRGSTEDVSDVLLRSWMRSRAKGARVAGPTVPDVAFVGRSELQIRQGERDRLRWVARRILGDLDPTLDGAGYVGLLTDRDGVILDRFGGGDFLARAERAQLTTGARWDEGVRGTNAIGTALAELNAVACIGSAHLHEANHRLVCYAAPIRSPQGELAGLLDLTGAVESASAFARGLVPTLAARIEEMWRRDAYDAAVEGGFVSLMTQLESTSAPAALVDAGGAVRFANSAMHTLGAVPDRLEALIGLRWTELAAMGEGSDLESAGRSMLAGRAAVVHPIRDREGRWIGASLEVLARSSRRVRSPRGRSAPPATAFAELDGWRDELQETVHRASRFAATNIPVLLIAETGSGKDVLARAIHRASGRHAGPFVALNCAAFTQSLLQSELFGYGAGAFTGALRKGRPGFVESADGGTLFLDEVADLPGSAQAALLRFLENGSYYRVGDTELRHADVRVLSATCCDLGGRVARGEFRRDLYYRLRGAQLGLPPLRTRRDLSEVARTFIARAAEEQGRAVPVLDPTALDAIQRYPWPGNFRELRQAMRVAVALCDDVVLLEDLPREVAEAAPVARGAAESTDAHEVLARHGGNVSAAARALGIARSTLYRRLRRD